MDHVEAPALLAYRGAEVFATLVDIFRLIPRGKNVTPESLEDLLKMYVLFPYLPFTSYSEQLLTVVGIGFCNLLIPPNAHRRMDWLFSLRCLVDSRLPVHRDGVDGTQDDVLSFVQ